MEDKKHIGKEINIVSNKIRRRVDNEVSKYGITGVQGKIIGFLYYQSQKRDIFQKDIENDFKIRSSSVTSVLNHMEKNGYIKRVSVCEDGRLKKIILTDKGIEVNETVFKAICDIEKQIEEELTEGEINFMFYILDKLSNKLSD